MIVLQESWILLGTSPSLEMAKKLIAEFFYGKPENYILNPIGDNEWNIESVIKKQVIDGIRIFKKAGRYRFERFSK